jgi:hypothetical protein
MITREIDLGQYIITVDYNEMTGEIDVQVLDELGELIEGINIKDEDDFDESDDTPFGADINLN